MRIGQIQLIRRQIANELNFSCKFHAKFLASGLNTMNKSVLLEKNIFRSHSQILVQFLCLNLKFQEKFKTITSYEIESIMLQFED